MRRLLKVFVAILMVLTLVPTSVLAEENTETASDQIGIRIGSEAYPVQEDVEFWIDPLYEQELANTPSLARASSTLNVKRLTQYDSRWGSDTLSGCSAETIASAGCALVSMTMVYNYLEGKSATPDEINDSYTVCPMPWTSLANNLGFSRVAYGSLSNSNAYSKLTQYINAGDPVIIQVNNGSYTHYMVVYGYNSSGSTLYVRDPDRTNFTTLKAANNSGWDAVYFHVFS